MGQFVCQDLFPVKKVRIGCIGTSLNYVGIIVLAISKFTNMISK